MDWMKRLTIKDYTVWDLNCPKIYDPRSAAESKRIFKRNARHRDKQTVEAELKEYQKND